MKALIALAPLCLLAACSGGEEPRKEEESAARLEAGQWEITSEVTAFRSTDNTTPALKAAVGDKSTHTACVGEGAQALPAELFSGEGYSCKYQNQYARGGRIGAALECSKEGITGAVPMTIQGTFTATSFEATVDTSTYLPGPGDFRMARKLTGRKTGGTCAAPAADEGEAKGKAKSKA